MRSYKADANVSCRLAIGGISPVLRLMAVGLPCGCGQGNSGGRLAVMSRFPSGRHDLSLLLPACGEKVGMRGRLRESEHMEKPPRRAEIGFSVLRAQTRGEAPSPAALRASTSPRKR